MEEELKKRLDEQGKRIEEIYRSVEKMRKYFLWTLIISVLVVVLPLIGLAFVLPNFLSIYSSGSLGL